MVVAASNPMAVQPLEGLGMLLRGWTGARVVAGITTRAADPAAWLSRFHARAGAQAEQVHGASLAIVNRLADVVVAGCDALITHVPGLALRIRTADCLPVFIADPVHQVIGLAHAGWRGIAAGLPARMVAGFHDVYHSDPAALQVAIGPAIRPCCYDVGPDFAPALRPFVQEAGGRRTCDLIGAAVHQLRGCGVRAERILDAGRCTACETTEWFSLRREGQQTGRLVSCLMLTGRG